MEENKASDLIIHSGFKPKLANDLIHMADLNKYKRRQAPPGVKITPKAVGKIEFAYHEQLSEKSCSSGSVTKVYAFRSFKGGLSDEYVLPNDR